LGCRSDVSTYLLGLRSIRTAAWKCFRSQHFTRFCWDQQPPNSGADQDAQCVPFCERLSRSIGNPSELQLHDGCRIWRVPSSGNLLLFYSFDWMSNLPAKPTLLNFSNPPDLHRAQRPNNATCTNHPTSDPKTRKTEWRAKGRCVVFRHNPNRAACDINSGNTAKNILAVKKRNAFSRSLRPFSMKEVSFAPYI
jgi:hypothetical protein